MTAYGTNITMSQDTVVKLTNGGFSLYGFKAVEAAAKGSPLVWFATGAYSLMTGLQWQEIYQAYTSRTELSPNTRITAAASYLIELQQTLEVTSSAGTGDVDTSMGIADAIVINNTTTTPFTCGLAQTDPSGNPSLTCGFSLYGINMAVVAPTATILLMFASAPINTGTVIEKAMGPGILIDLTGAPAVNGVPTREVKYDINQGWSWDKGSWGKKVAPMENLVPLLVPYSQALARLQLERLHKSTAR